MDKFKETINSLEKLIDNTENGCYEYDYEASLSGKIFYIKIIVKYASLYEMSCFFKELDNWKTMYNLKDYQILIEKEPKTFYEVGE
jgi:hypothetical protein